MFEEVKKELGRRTFEEKGFALAEDALQHCTHLYKISYHGNGCAITAYISSKLQESEVREKTIEPVH